MGKRILLIQAHPDASQAHLCHALENAYIQGAGDAGHELWRFNIAELNFSLLKSEYEWQQNNLPPDLQEAQTAIKWAEHIVFFFPLWLGDMPAILKGFLEQVARPGFAFSREAKNPLSSKLLGGRSARVVVTMGMPATVYRWYFRAHSIKSLERNILGLVGISPVNETLIGMTGNMDAAVAEKWLGKMKQFGAQGE
jgi:putative NADPH-quinone reductase